MSEEIAKRVGQVDAEQCYYAGLLHDIGLLVIDQSMHRPFAVIDRVAEALELCATETRGTHV
ncbi:MAG: HDOD domain-containing protein [Pirellulaceae bacterium]